MKGGKGEIFFLPETFSLCEQSGGGEGPYWVHKPSQ